MREREGKKMSGEEGDGKEGERKKNRKEKTKQQSSLSYLRAPSRSRKRPWEGSRRGCTRRRRPVPRRGSLECGFQEDRGRGRKR